MNPDTEHGSRHTRQDEPMATNPAYYVESMYANDTDVRRGGA